MLKLALAAFLVLITTGSLLAAEPRAPRSAPPKAAAKKPEASSFAAKIAEQVQPDEVDTAILESYRTRALFQPKKYAAVRSVMARRFERDFAAQIRAAYGSSPELVAWFDAHPEIKEEFYTAIDPECDDVPRVLAMFKELWAAYPKLIDRYANLAIAVAVTWDGPKNSVYRYDSLVRRARAKTQSGELEARANFEYIVAHEKLMQGRGQYLPWEFLTLLVDHPTPLAEREWALANYLGKRAMIGRCYSEVPYDYVMLDSKSVKAKLNGQAYTLANILGFGGVCAYQADFAARVGKSIGVPAAYVVGPGRFGDTHAWVMWVELRQVTASSISFSLESHGRYFGDHYYVGDLTDPQSGKQITDRALELRLHTVGRNVQGARQAKLAMRAYPRLVELAKLDVPKRFQFLRSVLGVCPGNEAAWTAVAQMSKEPEVQKQRKKELRTVMESLFRTFAGFPDFTWQVFDDLVAFEEDFDARVKFFERLEHLYIAAGRPDLAFAARTRLTDDLVEQKRLGPAIDGLAAAIKAFPDEGQYVPGMLDRLEALCEQVQGTDEQLLQFYMAFLPMIPQARGDEPSEYCIAMYERGIKRFQEHQLEQAAGALQAELAKVKAGSPRRGK